MAVDPDRAATCEGKTQFTSRVQADKIARQMRRRRNRRAETYRCPYCKYWHIGTAYVKVDRRKA